MSRKATLPVKERSGLFDVEVAFTGLGVVLLNSGEQRHNPNPKSVEFLLLRVPLPDSQGGASNHSPEGGHSAHGTGHNHNGNSGVPHNHEPHLPRLWFRLDDLAGPDNLQFNNMTAGTDGLPTVGLDLTDKNFSINIEVDEPTVQAESSTFDVRWASNETAAVALDALDLDFDLIPDLKEHFGLDSIVVPGPGELPPVYATRVSLPPGIITTRRPLLNPDNSQAEWVFVGEKKETPPNPQALTDQVIWSRKNVRSLHVDLEVGEGLTFNASVRESHGERPLVTLAITNLPRIAVSGRFGAPEHFALFQLIAHSGDSTIRQIQRTPALPGGDPITTGGACPPARSEF